MAAAPIVLVPGFWLGGWAWDDVAAILRADGHDVTAVTLPGLESADDDRSKVTLADHVDAVVAAVESKDAPVVLAVHSGAGAPGYAVTDRIPDRIAHMVYVDSGPAKGAMDPSFEAEDLPLPEWDDLGENLDGISEQQLATFRERAIPQPGAAMRETHEFANDERLDVPTTILCTSFTSDQIKAAAEEGQAWLGGVRELRNVTWVDMPTSHWPMWSRTEDVARLLADVARDAG